MMMNNRSEEEMWSQGIAQRKGGCCQGLCDDDVPGTLRKK
jgi:hypothetical protein